MNFDADFEWTGDFLNIRDWVISLFREGIPGLESHPWPESIEVRIGARVETSTKFQSLSLDEGDPVDLATRVEETIREALRQRPANTTNASIQLIPIYNEDSGATPAETSNMLARTFTRSVNTGTKVAEQIGRALTGSTARPIRVPKMDDPDPQTEDTTTPQDPDPAPFTMPGGPRLPTPRPFEAPRAPEVRFPEMRHPEPPPPKTPRVVDPYRGSLVDGSATVVDHSIFGILDHWKTELAQSRMQQTHLTNSLMSVLATIVNDTSRARDLAMAESKNIQTALSSLQQTAAADREARAHLESRVNELTAELDDATEAAEVAAQQRAKLAKKLKKLTEGGGEGDIASSLIKEGIKNFMNRGNAEPEVEEDPEEEPAPEPAKPKKTPGVPKPRKAEQGGEPEQGPKPSGKKKPKPAAKPAAPAGGFDLGSILGGGIPSADKIADLIAGMPAEFMSSVTSKLAKKHPKVALSLGAGIESNLTELLGDEDVDDSDVDDDDADGDDSDNEELDDSEVDEDGSEVDGDSEVDENDENDGGEE